MADLHIRTEENQIDAGSNCFVAFLDILGFQELVSNGDHAEIMGKLRKLRRTIDVIQDGAFIPKHFSNEQVRTVTFSDSIILFSRGDSTEDLRKIILDTNIIFRAAISQGIPLKGALSWGKVTADFKNSLFFGKPIINSYLLHEDLQMMAVVIDHNADVRMRNQLGEDYMEPITVFKKIPMKSGKIAHYVLKPSQDDYAKDYPGDEKKFMSELRCFYDSASGKHRIYVDNSVDFWGEVYNESYKKH